MIVDVYEVVEGEWIKVEEVAGTTRRPVTAVDSNPVQISRTINDKGERFNVRQLSHSDSHDVAIEGIKTSNYRTPARITEQADGSIAIRFASVEIHLIPDTRLVNRVVKRLEQRS